MSTVTLEVTTKAIGSRIEHLLHCAMLCDSCIVSLVYNNANNWPTSHLQWWDIVVSIRFPSAAMLERFLDYWEGTV